MLPNWVFSPLLTLLVERWLLGNNWIPKLRFSNLGRSAETGWWGDLGTGGRCPSGWLLVEWMLARAVCLHVFLDFQWGFACVCQLSCLTLCDPWTVDCQAPLSVGFSGKNPGVGCYFLFQGIFPTHWSYLLDKHIAHWIYCKLKIHLKHPTYCLS